MQNSKQIPSWAVFGVVAGLGGLAAVRIPGIVQGFGTLRKDNIVDAALVVPTLTAEQILAFELGDLMAPNEKMSAGPMNPDVPGNLFVPEQSENYGFFPVTLKKPEFGYYPKDSTVTELASYWAQAPFSELVAKVREKAPYKEILKLVTFKKFGLTDKNDWSRVTKITTQLNRESQGLGAYQWTRPVAGNLEVDLVLTFQETPHQRWMLGGLDTKSQARGNVGGVQGLEGLSKALFLRIINDAEHNPIAARGYFRNHSTERRGDFNVSGVPGPLGGLTMSDRRLITWTNPETDGLVGVFRTKKSKSINLFFAEELGLERKLESDEESMGTKSTEEWVPANTERYELSEALNPEEELVVVFVGSGELRIQPDVENMGAVLESASEIRLHRLK